MLVECIDNCWDHKREYNCCKTTTYHRRERKSSTFSKINPTFCRAYSLFIAAQILGGGSIKKNATQLARQLQESTGIETRATILGHIQRGGNPTLRDRVVASKMGYAAVELLNKGVGNRVVGLKDNKIVDYDIFEALNMVKAFDQETYSLSNIIAI